MPRKALSCARAGAAAGPIPAAATATAVSIAIAGGARRVLVGVPFKDIPIFCQIGREPSDVFWGGQRNWLSRLGHEGASNLRNAATAGQGGGSMGSKRCLRRQNSY